MHLWLFSRLIFDDRLLFCRMCGVGRRHSTALALVHTSDLPFSGLFRHRSHLHRPAPPRAMDPLSPPDDINAGWSSPTTSLRFNQPSAAEGTPPASATSNPYSGRNASASENENGFGTYIGQGLGGGAVGGDVGAGYREPVVFGAPGMGLFSPPPESQSQQETAAGAAQQERNAPRVYLRVRIGTLERNKKDLLIRFDASVRVIRFLPLTCRCSPLT